MNLSKEKPPLGKKKKKKGSLLAAFLAAPHIVWTVLFIVVPLVFVAIYAFTDREMNFTFANILDFFTPEKLYILWRSVKLALIATAICILIGYPAAYFISKANPRTQQLLIMLIMLPMWMNFLIRTYAWQVILQNKGIINSIVGLVGLGPFKMINTEGAVIVGIVYDFLPYMILPIYSVMTKLDIRLIEAASDLGCNGFQVLMKVIIPHSLPGVFSGITMVFVPSISTFYISQKLGGGKFFLIGDLIESQYNANNIHAAAAISLVLMLIILASMAILNKFSDDAEGGIMP